MTLLASKARKEYDRSNYFKSSCSCNTLNPMNPNIKEYVSTKPFAADLLDSRSS